MHGILNTSATPPVYWQLYLALVGAINIIYR